MGSEMCIRDRNYVVVKKIKKKLCINTQIDYHNKMVVYNSGKHIIGIHLFYWFPWRHTQEKLLQGRNYRREEKEININ